MPLSDAVLRKAGFGYLFSSPDKRHLKKLGNTLLYNAFSASSEAPAQMPHCRILSCIETAHSSETQSLCLSSRPEYHSPAFHLYICHLNLASQALLSYEEVLSCHCRTDQAAATSFPFSTPKLTLSDARKSPYFLYIFFIFNVHIRYLLPAFLVSANL